MKVETTPDGVGARDGVIGIVGVAPWSTLQFCEVLYKQVPASKDWHFPRVIVDVNTKMPSRGRHFDLGEEDFSPYIHDSIRKLKKMGAEVVVVTCNTAHIYYDRWSYGVGVHVPHIGQECVSAVKVTGSIRPAIFCGWSLRAAGFYECLFADSGLDVVCLMNDEARIVVDAIEDVKQVGSLRRANIEKIDNVLENLKARGADSLVLACTELSSLEAQAATFFPVIVDSNVVLAQAALRIAAPGITGNL